MILLCCHNVNLYLGVLQGNKMIAQFPTGGARLWLAYVIKTLFKKGSLNLVAFSEKDGVSITYTYLVNAISRLLIINSMLSLVLQYFSTHLPFSVRDMEVLYTSMIVSIWIFLFAVSQMYFTGKTIRKQEDFLARLFTVADLIQYAVEDKYGADHNQVSAYMTTVHLMFSSMKSTDVRQWIDRVDIDRYIDAFEINEKKIMGKEDNPINATPINRKDPSSWSIWLKQFIGQSMLTDLFKALPSDIINTFSEQDQKNYKDLQIWCHSISVEE